MGKTTYQKLKTRPENFRRLTGITVEKFDEIMEKLRPSYELWNMGRLTKRNRKNAIGAGNRHHLTLEDRLLMLLLYYRTYVSYVFLELIFPIDSTNVGRNMNPLQPLLAGIFKIPEHRIEMSKDEILELFFDGVEQPMQRPKHGQKKWYSGKKKRHTIKHQIVVAKIKKKGGKTCLRIKSISKSFVGTVHDKKMYEKIKTRIPPNRTGYGDSGYQGTILQIPIKKPKGKKLTEAQQEYNRILSSMRVVVEHSIGKMKIWQILAQRFRNQPKRHTLIMKNIAGLHNLMFDQ